MWSVEKYFFNFVLGDMVFRILLLSAVSKAYYLKNTTKIYMIQEMVFVCLSVRIDNGDVWAERGQSGLLLTLDKIDGWPDHPV